jgi:ATP-dependent Clp protease protease subunit
MNFSKLVKVSSIAALSLASATASAFEFKVKPKLSKPEVSYELTPETVVLRGEVDEAFVSKAIREIELSKSDDVVVYINSPGGSVISGMKLVSYIRSTPKKITCVVDVAISMAFVILQACDERVSTSNSIAMQHVTAYGIRQQQAPNAVSFQKFLERMAEKMDKAQAKRIGLSYDAFKKLTRNDWWTIGDDVSEAKVTDRTVSLTCSKKAIEATIEEVIPTPMGNMNVTWSACPLVSTPLKVNADKVRGQQSDVQKYIDKLEPRKEAITKMEVSEG